MIIVPRCTDVEVRVLRTIVARPWLLGVVPDIGLDEFENLVHRLLWKAIRNTTIERVPGSSAELLLACAEWLVGQPGADQRNMYGILAAEIVGERHHLATGQAPYLDPRVTEPDEISTDAHASTQLRSDYRTLSYARRARAQMQEQQDAATTRRPSS